MAKDIVVFLAGLRGVKLRRAIESTDLRLRYFELEAHWPWRQRLRILGRVLATIWHERRETAALMMDFIGGYSLIAILVCRLVGVPFVMRLRGDIWRETREALRLAQDRGERLELRWRLALAAWVISRADLIVPVSSYLCQRVLAEVQRLNTERVIPLPVYIDLDRFYPDGLRGEIRQTLDLEADSLIVGTVTNFAYYEKAKGLLEALDVLDPLMRQKHRIHWLIAGDGVFQPRIEQEVLSRASLPDHIHFLRYLSDVSMLYQACDMLVHFSFMDAFPNVVLEAQAASLPVVVNDFGGMSEQVQHGVTGYVVSLQDVEHVRHLVSHLLKDQEMREHMGLAGRHWVEASFHYSVVGRRFADALRVVSAIGKAP